MAITFGAIKTLQTKGLGGIKIKIVPMTFDAAYVAATGYVVTAAQCGMKKILFISASPIGYQSSVKSYNADGSVNLTMYKGNTNSSDNEAGLNTLLVNALVIGY